MVSHPELGSDPPIGSDRESGCDKGDRNDIFINNIFSFQMTFYIIRNDKDPKPRNVEECRNRNDWPKWKEAIQIELNSLVKQDIFRHVV